MDILGKIRKLQRDRQWTDYKLAQEADIPLATLVSLFQRNNPPKIETLQSLCKAFGLTLAQFFLENEKIEVLSDTEKEMLKVFRRLSPKQKRALVAVFQD